MKIAVDVDGVILAMIPKVCEIYNKAFNTNYTKEDVKQWEFFKDWNISEESMYKIFYQVYTNSQTLSLVDKDAPQVLKKLYKKYFVDLVTARDLRFEGNLIEKLNSLGIKKGTHYENLIHVEAKPYDSKLSLDYDIIIDDNPNLINTSEGFPNKKILLYNQPWNRNFKEKINLKRVENWKQIQKEIEKLETLFT